MPAAASVGIDRGRRRPSAKAPVPKVILAWPARRQPWPNRAACWSTRLAVIGSRPQAPKSPAVGRISASASIGTPNRRHSSGSHWPVFEVHQAGARGRGGIGGVGARQPVEEEAVAGAEPQLALGASSGLASGRWSMIQRSLLAEK